jgi:two-component system, sensor histidine kinase and response regulator
MEPIEWSALSDNCAGDDSLIKEVLDLFQVEAPALLADVHAAVAKGDALAIKRTAHRLKGALVSLAAEPSTAAARDLERMGTEGAIAGAAEALARLDTEMARLLEVLGARARAA